MLSVLLCICLYRQCAERWRRRHEYDLTTQFESAPPLDEHPPPAYHNLSMSTGLALTNRQAVSGNRGASYRSTSQTERRSNSESTDRGNATDTRRNTASTGTRRNNDNDSARETLLSNDDSEEQSDNDNQSENGET